MRISNAGTLGALGVLSVGLLSGCGSSGASDSGKPQVVASTDVWGSVAQAVGGDHVDVTSVISDPSQDPHSYEANTQTLLAISRADVIVENGGGYDDFMDQMISSSHASAQVIDAVSVSGKTAPAGGDLNEHVFYDFPTVQRMADTIATDLAAVDPTHAAAYTANAAAFDSGVQTLIGREAALREKYAGDPIGITEPVPLYLTDAVGLVDETPAAFSEAIEEGDDVAVPVLHDTLNLYSDHAVDALVYNEQTTGAITDQVQQAAASAGVPLVPVTETLPSGDDYLTWMQANLTALGKALAS